MAWQPRLAPAGLYDQAVDGILHCYYYRLLNDRRTPCEGIAARYWPEVRPGFISLQPLPDFTTDGKPSLVSDYHYKPFGNLIEIANQPDPVLPPRCRAGRAEAMVSGAVLR
ncbi:hypothetical protein [Parachitinimonas caeni]|uniref:RHS repeat-associated protein n=1 Tax=Parachitinimonas caeni TaxID=3031301 RepID=A0ABT7E3L8_9NEIS|nr:hypothetical protein [Parachitinimonas caeni]MDK2126917.1 hypothetical protein [Parachitinimonas caeni]